MTTAGWPGGGQQLGRDRNPRVEGAIDAVEQMADIVDSLEGYLLQQATERRHGTRYRLNLLWVHATAALLMAPLLSLTGRDGMTGPSLAFLRTLPGAPVSVAAALGTGGMILGMGCIFRAKRWEIVGLCGLLVFYVLYGVSLAVPPIRWVLHPDGVKPPLYAPVIYAHLAVIMGLHMRALIISVRDDLAMAQHVSTHRHEARQ